MSQYQAKHELPKDNVPKPRAPHPASRPLPKNEKHVDLYSGHRDPTPQKAKATAAKSTTMATPQKSTTPPTREKTILKVEDKNPITNYFRWRKEYYGNLSKGEKIRHRALQVMVALSVCVITVAVAMDHFVKLPEVPTAPTPAPSIVIDPEVADTELIDGGLDFAGAEYPLVSQSGRKEGVYTFLVAGRDTVSNSTDTMILVTYDTVNKTINGMSLLRDTMVNINAFTPKLNHVYSYFRGKDPETQVQKGTDAMKLQVSRLTGIVPDFYVLIEWEAVGLLVDAIGGVEFEVPYNMKYDDPVQNLHIDQPAGLRLLDGEDAMEVIRHRQNNGGANSVGDIGRTEVQQDFLIAVAQTCLTPKMLKNAQALAEIFINNVETDLTIGNLLAFAQLALGIDLENDVNMYPMPYKDMNRWCGTSYVGVNSSEMLTLMNTSFNPYLDTIQSSDLQLMYSNKDGSFGVTNAALAYSKMGNAANNTSYNGSSSSSASSSTTDKKDEPDPDLDLDDDTTTLPGQPDPVLPDPNGTGGTGSSGTGSSGSSGTGSSGSSGTGSSGSSGTGSSGSSGTGSSGSSGTGSSGSTDTGTTSPGDPDTETAPPTDDSSGSGSTDSNTGTVPDVPSTETPPPTEENAGSGSTGDDLVVVPPATSPEPTPSPSQPSDPVPGVPEAVG